MSEDLMTPLLVLEQCEEASLTLGEYRDTLGAFIEDFIAEGTTEYDDEIIALCNLQDLVSEMMRGGI